MSDLGASVTTALIVLTAVLVIGLLLDLLGRKILHTDLAAFVYKHTGISGSGRFRNCTRRKFQELMEISYRRAQAEQAFRRHSSTRAGGGGWLWPKLVRSLVKTFGSGYLIDLAFCHETVVIAVDRVYLGLAALTLLGLPLVFRDQLRAAVVQVQGLGLGGEGGGGGGGGDGLLRLLPVGIQLACFLSGGNRMLVTIAAAACCIREVYHVFILEGRRAALALGETIQEPLRLRTGTGAR